MGVTLQPGQDFGAYRVIERAGAGGMATVFKAYQASLSRYVAIKVLPDYLLQESGFRERFELEARAVAGLRHPSIPAIFEHGEIDGVVYLVTEFADGGTLADQLGKPLPTEYAVSALRPIAAALDYAHARGIIHRDIKPTNILFTRDGRTLLNDFGLARMMSAEVQMTQAGMIMGTPQYMSPEQCSAEEVGPASDIYALAMVAYEMLTGRVAFNAATPTAVVLAQLSGNLPPPQSINPAISDGVQRALLAGLARNPADRPRSASDLITALERGATDQSSAETRPLPGAAAPPRDASTVVLAPSAPAARSKTPLVAAGAALLVLLVGGGTAYALSHRAGSAGGHQDSASPAAATVTTAPPLRKGALAWQARLDGHTADYTPWFDVGDPGSAVWKNTPGAIEGDILKGTANLAVNYGFTIPRQRYIGELTFHAAPGSSIDLQWVLRQGDNSHGLYFLDFDTAANSMQLSYLTSTVNDKLGPAIPLPGLSTGQAYTLQVLADPPLYAVYEDGRPVVAVKDQRGLAQDLMGMTLYGTGGKVFISALRQFDPA